jgi:hypothetical protein
VLNTYTKDNEIF